MGLYDYGNSTPSPSQQGLYGPVYSPQQQSMSSPLTGDANPYRDPFSDEMGPLGRYGDPRAMSLGGSQGASANGTGLGGLGLHHILPIMMMSMAGSGMGSKNGGGMNAMMPLMLLSMSGMFGGSGMGGTK